MVFDRQKDISWSRLCAIGSHWKLLSFDRLEPPSWENFWIEKREYWGADDENKSRVQHYFGKDNTESKLLADTQKAYDDYVEHLSLWNGLCRVGETVKVIPLTETVIALSKDWKGRVSDHSDLEIWLKEEKTLLFRHVRYCCEVYSFGTIWVPPDSFEEAMGESAGRSRVSHRKGDDLEVNLREYNGQKAISIGDAKFCILN